MQQKPPNPKTSSVPSTDVGANVLAIVQRLDVSVSHADLAIDPGPPTPGSSPLTSALVALSRANTTSLCTPAAPLRTEDIA